MLQYRYLRKTIVRQMISSKQALKNACAFYTARQVFLCCLFQLQNENAIMQLFKEIETFYE
jgi:hypothetical protein